MNEDEYFEYLKVHDLTCVQVTGRIFLVLPSKYVSFGDTPLEALASYAQRNNANPPVQSDSEVPEEVAELLKGKSDDS